MTNDDKLMGHIFAPISLFRPAAQGPLASQQRVIAGPLGEPAQTRTSGAIQTGCTLNKGVITC
jgi:hypothetical protein